MSPIDAADATQIRLLRGVPTRIRLDGTTYLLGIHGVAPDESTVKLGVHVDGSGITTQAAVGDAVVVGSLKYVVTQISGHKVTLSRQQAG